jgi:hypothetical protein
VLEFFRRLPLYVSAGKVACKARACDVSIETCADCGALDSIVDEGGNPVVYCHRHEDRTLSVLSYPR